MSPRDYAKSINRTPRCVQKWCAAGLIGKRIGGRWEIDDGTPPPEIETGGKLPRAVGGKRLQRFRRKVMA